MNILSIYQCSFIPDVDYEVVLHKCDYTVVHCTLDQKSLYDKKKTQPNILPSKIIPKGRIYFDFKIKAVSCNWSQELG